MSEWNMPEGANDSQHETGSIQDPPDYDDRDEDDYDPEFACLICGGDGMVENDDPIQRGPAEFLKCYSCNGSGKRKDMTVW